jgi:hypothetical protein
MKLSIINCEDYEFEILVQTYWGNFCCYAYQINDQKINDLRSAEFSTLYAKNIFLNEEEQYSIKKTEEGYFSYRVIGKYLGSDKIKFEDCVFALDSQVPKDINIGEFVSFEFLRTDLII